MEGVPDLPYLGLRRDLPRVEDPSSVKLSYPTPSSLLNVKDPIRVSPDLMRSIDDVAYRKPEATSYDPTQAMGHVQGMDAFKDYRVSEERPYSKTTGAIL